LVNFLEEKGWGILNGCTKGDEEGEYTFTGGKGNTVIDYIIGNEDVRANVENLIVGDRVDSDHHLLEVRIKGREQKSKERMKGRESRNRRGNWNEYGRKEFKERIEKVLSEEGGRCLGKEEMERKMRGVICEVEKEISGTKEKRGGWWDKECKGKKREVRKELREWRKRGGKGKTIGN